MLPLIKCLQSQWSVNNFLVCVFCLHVCLYKWLLYLRRNQRHHGLQGKDRFTYIILIWVKNLGSFIESLKENCRSNTRFPTTQKSLNYWRGVHVMAPCVECSSDLPSRTGIRIPALGIIKALPLNAADTKWIKLLLELR